MESLTINMEIVFGVIYLLVYILISIWVASVQVKVRTIKPFLAYFWCIFLAPLLGWVLIAIAYPRKINNQ